MSDDPMGPKLCGAKTRAGGTCRKPGDPRCRFHGGASPQAIAARKRRAAEAEANAAVRQILDDPNAPPVADALDRLAHLAGRLEHAVDEVGRRASDLRSVGVQTHAGGEQLRAELVLWVKLLGLLQTSLDVLVRHGHAERQIELAEREGAMLAGVVRAILDDLGLSEGQRALVAEVVPRHLRAVAG